MVSFIKNRLSTALLALPLILVVVLIIRSTDVQIETLPPSDKIAEVVKKEEETKWVSLVKDVLTPVPGPELFEYIKVVDGCGPHFEGSCVNVRTSPKSSAPVAYKLRSGVILRVNGKVTADGREWYVVYFNEWLRYPDRVAPKLYIAAEFVESFFDEGSKESTPETKSSKRIIVDRGEQMLYAYDGDELFMKEKVSTGLELTPTPRGVFTVYRKTPSRYMQGPIPGISTHYYDLPGVPWNLYFSKEGAVIHGAYWHDSFGKRWSNGCVNMPIESAEKLYTWADVGTEVLVRD